MGYFCLVDIVILKSVNKRLILRAKRDAIMVIKSLEMAEFILIKERDNKRAVNPTRLQSLLYYVQVYCIVKGYDLDFCDDLILSFFSPLFSDVYDKYTSYGNNTLTLKKRHSFSVPISSNIIEDISALLSLLAEYNATKLYTDAYTLVKDNNVKSKDIISCDKLKECYSKNFPQGKTEHVNEITPELFVSILFNSPSTKDDEKCDEKGDGKGSPTRSVEEITTNFFEIVSSSQDNNHNKTIANFIATFNTIKDKNAPIEFYQVYSAYSAYANEERDEKGDDKRSFDTDVFYLLDSFVNKCRSDNNISDADIAKAVEWADIVRFVVAQRTDHKLIALNASEKFLDVVRQDVTDNINKMETSSNERIKSIERQSISTLGIFVALMSIIFASISIGSSSLRLVSETSLRDLAFASMAVFIMSYILVSLTLGKIKAISSNVTKKHLFCPRCVFLIILILVCIILVVAPTEEVQAFFRSVRNFVGFSSTL